MTLHLAAWLDRWESRLRAAAEHLDPRDPPWLREFRDYLGDPRLSRQEFFVRYTLKRMDAQARMKAVDADLGLARAEQSARHFYETDYMLWRNLVHRRHSAWRRVLLTMTRRGGTLLEVGCGIAPVSAYCAPRALDWCYWLHDLPSAHRDYGEWRVRRTAAYVAILSDPFPPHAEHVHIITALDVFEHLAEPLERAQRCVETLAPGGYLHWTFPATDGRELDLATPEQRAGTIRYLESALVTVYDRDGYRVSVKR